MRLQSYWNIATGIKEMNRMLENKTWAISTCVKLRNRFWKILARIKINDLWLMHGANYFLKIVFRMNVELLNTRPKLIYLFF